MEVTPRCICLELLGIGGEPIQTAGGTSVDGGPPSDILIARMVCPQCGSEWTEVLTETWEVAA